LIEHWGMTREEVAGRGHNSPAYLSIMLRGVEEDSYPIGVLYIDSSVVGAFGNDTVAREIAIAIEKSEDVKLLSKALEKALTPLRLAAPDMDIGHRVGQSR